MPDLMTHFTASYLLKRAVASRENMMAFLLGTTLPDILAYTPLMVAAYIPPGSLPAWIKQAKDNQKPKTDWLLFVKKNHHEEVVVLDATVFFKLMSEIQNLENELKGINDKKSDN